MKNLYRLIFCLTLMTCGSDESSGNDDVINLPAIISANVSSLSFESTMVTQISDSQVIIISAENTTSEIFVVSPNGYEVSLDNNSFSQEISFIPEISNEIYVRFMPTEITNYYSSLTISSQEVSNININLFGIGTMLLYNYQTFQNQALGFGGGFSQSSSQLFNLHDDLSNIEQIKMFLQINCPSTGCDDWDRFANVKVKDQTTGKWYEIARYITPYWVGTQELERGLEFDVTDFKSLLTGSTELRIYIENWTQKADLVSIEFDYIDGTPDYPYYAVSEILNFHANSIDGVPYGVSHNLDLNKNIQIPSNADRTHLRTIISGWGHATPVDSDGRPCAEWCYRTHDVKINGAITYQHYMGPIGCATNPINNQAPGNWMPNRAGWCPGMAVPVRIDDIGLSFNGNGFDFEYDFQNWSSDGGSTSGQTGAYYAISSYVVVKSSTEISSPAVID